MLQYEPIKETFTYDDYIFVCSVIHSSAHFTLLPHVLISHWLSCILQLTPDFLKLISFSVFGSIH